MLAWFIDSILCAGKHTNIKHGFRYSQDQRAEVEEWWSQLKSATSIYEENQQCGEVAKDHVKALVAYVEAETKIMRKSKMIYVYVIVVLWLFVGWNYM